MTKPCSLNLNTRQNINIRNMGMRNVAKSILDWIRTAMVLSTCRFDSFVAEMHIEYHSNAANAFDCRATTTTTAAGWGASNKIIKWWNIDELKYCKQITFYVIVMTFRYIDLPPPPSTRTNHECEPISQVDPNPANINCATRKFVKNHERDKCGFFEMVCRRFALVEICRAAN